MDLLLDLRDATKAKLSKTLYDANGKEIDPQRLITMYEEIRKVREPWRGEWLDAKFVDSQGMRMLSGYKLSGRNQIAPQYNQPLESCLDQNTTFSLSGLNSQGLPTKEDAKSTFYFYKPVDGRVAGFLAYSVRAILNCGRVPSDRDSELGVRAARVKN